MRASICTFTGRELDIFNPREQDIDILDIAHALSQLCRFGGHSREFYSVAQHSVLVSQLCDPADAPAALLHDAAEAYVMDLPTPIKRQFPAYAEMERGILKVIFRRFGLRAVPLMPASVAAADRRALEIEQFHLMPTVAWWPKVQMDDFAVGHFGYAPPVAKTRFMERFRELFEMDNATLDLPCKVRDVSAD